MAEWKPVGYGRNLRLQLNQTFVLRFEHIYSRTSRMNPQSWILYMQVRQTVVHTERAPVLNSVSLIVFQPVKHWSASLLLSLPERCWRRSGGEMSQRELDEQEHFYEIRNPNDAGNDDKQVVHWWLQMPVSSSTVTSDGSDHVSSFSSYLTNFFTWSCVHTLLYIIEWIYRPNSSQTESHILAV